MLAASMMVCGYSRVVRIRFDDEHRVIVLAVVACCAMVVFAGIAIKVIAGFNEIPAWWLQADAIQVDDQSVKQQAEELENAITTQLTAVRSVDDPKWSVAISIEQMNAWAVARLEDTIVTHRGEAGWPNWLSRVRVGVDDDQLLVGMRTRSISGSVIAWGRVGFEIDEAGDLWIVIDSLVIGQSRLPVGLSAMLANADIDGKRYRVGPAKLSLGDGRDVRVLGLQVRAGRLELMMETVPTSKRSVQD